MEVFPVQNFTTYIYMGGDPFETEQAYYVAKMIDAVIRAVKAIAARIFLSEAPAPTGVSFTLPTYLPNSPLLESP